jgi:uncharacterized protein DUF4405
MKKDMQKTFNRRAFVALGAVISGIGLPFSGFANHILQSDPIGLHRHAWMAAHWSLAIIFTTFVIWHAILNRRALVKHFKRVPGNLCDISLEVILASVLVGIPFFLAVLHAFIAA